MRKGFTLVELSIVLVIVGLLIGGIVAAQSMIRTTKIIKYTEKIQQYNIAIRNFRSNYKSVPGDSNLFTPAGNNNNQTDGGGCRGTYSGWEIGYVWSHLTDAKMIKGNYTKWQNIACGGSDSDNFFDKNLVGVIGPEFGTVPNLPSSWWGGNTTKTMPVYSYVSGYGESIYVVVTGEEAIALDKKNDDGDVNSGEITSNDDGNPCVITSAVCQIYFYAAP